MPKAEYVLINNEITLYDDKGPHTPSGHGILGGVIYDKQKDLVKCYECGAKFKSVGAHIWQRHKLTADEYRLKYSIMKKSALCNEAVRVRHIQLGKRYWENLSGKERTTAMASLAEARSRIVSRGEGRRTVEHQNKTSDCKPQMLAKLREAGEQLGRAPYVRELKEFRLSIRKIDFLFGSYKKFLALARLEMNKKGSHSPSKEDLIACMQNAAQVLGRTPSQSDCRRGFLPAAGTYSTNFGSWVQAIIAANLSPRARQLYAAKL